MVIRYATKFPLGCIHEKGESRLKFSARAPYSWSVTSNLFLYLAIIGLPTLHAAPQISKGFRALNFIVFRLLVGLYGIGACLW